MSTILNEDALPHIDTVKIDEDVLRGFQDEDDFIDLAVQLVVEAGSYTVIAHSIMDELGGWDRDQAILGGLMVRLYKLLARSSIKSVSIELRSLKSCAVSLSKLS